MVGFPMRSAVRSTGGIRDQPVRSGSAGEIVEPYVYYFHRQHTANDGTLTLVLLDNKSSFGTTEAGPVSLQEKKKGANVSHRVVLDTAR
jgi:hypothetical protein